MISDFNSSVILLLGDLSSYTNLQIEQKFIETRFVVKPVVKMYRPERGFNDSFPTADAKLCAAGIGLYK